MPYFLVSEVAEVLISKFNGSFVNCVKASDKSAQKLLQIITDNFPPFRDVADFAGKKVSILKRAQILVADVWALFKGKGELHLTQVAMNFSECEI